MTEMPATLAFWWWTFQSGGKRLSAKDLVYLELEMVCSGGRCTMDMEVCKAGMSVLEQGSWGGPTVGGSRDPPFFFGFFVGSVHWTDAPAGRLVV